MADSIPYNADSTTYRLWDRYNLYVALQFADTSILADSTVIDFIDSFQVSALGRLLAVQAAMDTLDVADTLVYDTLHARINAISGSNDFENNMKAYTNDYLLLMAKGNNPEIASAINDMATQCVFPNGPAVLQARAFMMQTDNALMGKDWNGDCAGAYKTDAVSKVKEKPTYDYRLVPNLYKDNFTASISLGENEQGQVQIFDINGRLIGSHSVSSGKNMLNLSPDGLQAGIYLYRVTVNGVVKTNDKLVVVH